jgi:hypothetical protein
VFWDLGFGFQISGFRFRVSGFGCRVCGVGCRISGFRFRGPGSGFSDLGSGCRMSGLGFWVSGLGVNLHRFGLGVGLCPAVSIVPRALPMMGFVVVVPARSNGGSASSHFLQPDIRIQCAAHGNGQALASV